MNPLRYRSLKRLMRIRKCGGSTATTSYTAQEVGLSIGRRAHWELVAALVLVVGVVLVATRPAARLPAGSMPAIRSVVEREIVASLGGAGEIRIVSDFCGVCRDRAKTYLTQARQRNTLLIVEQDTASRYFRRMLAGDSTASGRTIFLSPTELRRRLHVRAFPSVIRVDEHGSVVETGLWSAGRLRALLQPRQWLSAWREVV